MSPLIRIDDKILEGLNQLGIKYSLINESVPEGTGKTNTSDFVYVPASGLYVARERSHKGLNWNESHEALSQEGTRMITIPEFVEFLKYLKANPSSENTETYNDITQVRSPWRAEWLDAYFEKRGRQWNILTGNRSKTKKLEGALMEDRTPGISLDSWLENPDSSGLPRQDVAEGSLYYWGPRDALVARFGADSDWANLDCCRNPSNWNSGLGVRAVKEAGAEGSPTTK